MSLHRALQLQSLECFPDPNRLLAMLASPSPYLHVQVRELVSTVDRAVEDVRGSAGLQVGRGWGGETGWSL